MKKYRIRGKFTVVNEVSVSRPSPRLLLFICIVLNCNPQRAFRLFRPSSWKFTNETFLTRGGGNLLADQWQCEYVYNSNLSLTGVLQECEKARTSVSMFQRGAQGCSRAAFLSMCCVTYGISGVAGLVARVHRKGFAAGLHAVDHYVYRLRRLII